MNFAAARIGLLVSLSLLLVGCGNLFPKTIKVGSKNSTEQIILGEILAQAIEKKTAFKVERRLGLGDTAILHQAAIARDVDVFAEDTTSAIAVILKENVIMDATALHERVRNEYGRLYRFQVSKPVGATAATVMAVPKALVEKERLTDLSTAAASKVGWKIGMTEDFATRKEGFTNLSTNYRLTLAVGPRTMDPTSLFQALTESQVNMASALETDGMLADPAIATLADDKRIFPPTQICLITRAEALQSFAGLDGVLNQFAGKVTTDELRRMGYDALKNKRPPAAIAADFLARTGLR